MLPFLNKKKLNTTMLFTAKPSGDVQMDDMAPKEENHGLLAAAQDLLDAVEAKDAARVASALEAAIMLCDTDDSEELA